jgi:hypothetical protein
MKAVMLFMLLGSVALCQMTSKAEGPSTALRTELRTSSNQIRMLDEVVVTVFFRSDKEITLWNFLKWGAPAGLYLRVLDSSGREVQNTFAPFLHPLPPDLTGKDALTTIGGNVFTGFDSRIQAKTLFPKPGSYRLYCLYSPPLSRHYFQGQTIWGKEDGTVESSPVSVTVDQ